MSPCTSMAAACASNAGNTRAAVLAGLHRGWLAHLERRFPPLAALGLSGLEHALNTGQETGQEHALETGLEAYFAEVVHLDANAARVALRNRLLDLLEARPGGLPAPLVRTLADRAARLEMDLGFSHRALKLPCSPGVLAEARARRERHLAAYGGPSVGTVSRGGALKHYFRNHPRLLRGRDVLHLGPEAELKAWIVAEAGARTYVDADPFLEGTALALDMARMDLPGGSFDVVVCHRVLEHVYDDAAALAEVWRVLRPGGLFSVSVPLSLDLERAVEWHVPDPRRHGHLRTYGADFPELLRGAGFEAREERWLLGRSAEELERAGAYNMLLFHGFKQGGPASDSASGLATDREGA
ncbi:MAG: class I SAM-dependent methyltransferase [Desulfovibrionaceae bacterium]